MKMKKRDTGCNFRGRRIFLETDDMRDVKSFDEWVQRYNKKYDEATIKSTMLDLLYAQNETPTISN